MRRIYLFPNFITAFGLACGLYVIFKIQFATVESVYDIVLKSALILLLAGFADILDGVVARIFHAESEFGTIFDSLADSISFGVAPSVLLLHSLFLHRNETVAFFLIASAMLFSICAVLRLVRFNVREQEVRGDREAELLYKKSFTGLPVPAGAAASVSLILLMISPELEDWVTISPTASAWILIGVMILLSYLMISKWKFPTIKTVRIRMPSFPLIFACVFAALFILYGLQYFPSVVFVAISFGYILLGFILSIIRLIAGKKSKTLEEFDPESDE